ncbi:catalase, partial [Tahibacter sp.]|uniref:catalase n=1 Tax=Tahibacter sp. TaxID=2056211 RepID=UPI0028C3BA2E
VFFIRDAIKFPDMVHSLKPSPTTNIQDPNRFFDFFSHVPESTHMLTRVYSDLGTPTGYRFMDGSSVHAYKFVNAAGDYRYVKFRWASKQGVRTLDAKQVAEVQARDFNHLTRDLVDAIARKEYPQWDLFIQVLEAGQLAGFDFDPLDATKIWPDVPETRIGTMTLNRNPSNVFQETEQSAFAPANLVPGIEPSEDRLLQGRIFSYADTQLYRVGANGLQLPINRPVAAVLNGNQDGAANIRATTTDVNYQPSRRFAMTETADAKYSALPLSGSSQQQRIARTLNFRQAGEFYRTLDATAKKNLVANLAGDLGQVTHPDTRLTMLSHFYKADADYGTRLTQALKDDLAQVRRAAESLAE